MPADADTGERKEKKGNGREGRFVTSTMSNM